MLIRSKDMKDQVYFISVLDTQNYRLTPLKNVISRTYEDKTQDIQCYDKVFTVFKWQTYKTSCFVNANNNLFK